MNQNMNLCELLPRTISYISFPRKDLMRHDKRPLYEGDDRDFDTATAVMADAFARGEFTLKHTRFIPDDEPLEEDDWCIGELDSYYA